MDSLIERLEDLTKVVPEDEAIRKRLYNVTQKLNLAVEPPQMTIQRIIYTVSTALYSWPSSITNYTDHLTEPLQSHYTLQLLGLLAISTFSSFSPRKMARV